MGCSRGGSEGITPLRSARPGFCLTIYADLSSQTVGLACLLWPVLAFPQGWCWGQGCVNMDCKPSHPPTSLGPSWGG